MNIQKAGYQGIWLPDLRTALAGYHPGAEVSFVSHAHSDHVPSNRRASVYATPATLDLMRARGFKGEGTPLRLGEWVECGSFSARLYTSGRIVGSSMISIEQFWITLLCTG